MTETHSTATAWQKETFLFYKNQYQQPRFTFQKMHQTWKFGDLKDSEYFSVIIATLTSFTVFFLVFFSNLFQVSAGELERLMVRLPSMFRQELSGVGATLEKRWKFCGFDSLSSAWRRQPAHTKTFEKSFVLVCVRCCSCLRRCGEWVSW